MKPPSLAFPCRLAVAFLLLLLFAIAALPASATVTVTSPGNGVVTSSPVQFTATASASTCSQGVAAMGIYVNNSLVYQVQASSLNTAIALSPGTYSTVVQEWDNCGGSTTSTETVTVPGGSTQNGVVITSPASGSTVASPVNFAATAGSTSCASGVAAMGIYVDNQLLYTSNGSTLNTALNLSGGTQQAVVQEWDNCGGSLSSTVNFTVPGGSTQNGVVITSPASGSTVTSPVSFAATAGTTSCASGVAAMGVYVNSQLLYTSNGSTLNTTLSVTPGAQQAVVQEWDNCGGSLSSPVNFTVSSPASVSMEASPASIFAGGSSTLNVTATNATQVVITGSDGSRYTLPADGGSQSVSPSATTTYTATADGTASATATVTVSSASGISAINHVIFLLQENHSFDNYFGMLNTYRAAHNWSVGDDGQTYSVDGIDDKLSRIANQSDEGATYAPFKLKSTCVQDLTSSWLESYGDVSRYDFSPSRGINIDGFVHTAENFAKNCQAGGGSSCAGTFSDFTGRPSMGYYDDGFLNYYYYMASQFAVSDRWFSPLSSKSTPNRIATFSGGTTQGLAFDPGVDDHLPQLGIQTIFDELSSANVSWKIYYTVTQGSCLDADDCPKNASAQYPATDFSYFSGADKYLYENPEGDSCVAPTQPSSVVGDPTNSFCIDTSHIAPLSSYYSDLTNGTLPSFGFIEAGYGVNDEHPGSGQSVLTGQQEVASLVNALMNSSSWMQSVFFLAYDEGGGPYDHVPPVPGHSNDDTDATLGSTPVGSIPDISSISVNPDSFPPCVPESGGATTHCDLVSSAYPGAHATDAAAVQGFAAQLGFRVPNMVISPYTRKHYVSHIPMDHTAILKFVENRFIGGSAHLTARDAAQPTLLDFFDFSGVPWATPPTPPTPVSPNSLGYDPCTPTNLGS